MSSIPAGVPTREIYWNVPFHDLLYVFLVPTLAIAAWGVYRRVRLWRAGQPILRFDRLGERLDLFVKDVLAQGRVVRSSYAAFFHTGLVIGFLVLFAATTVVAIQADLKIPIMQGPFYLFFQSLTVDLFGLYVLVGCAMAGYRRWKTKPAKLVYTDEATRLVLLIGVISLTGFLCEGWRIAVTDDPWGGWSPVGFVFAAASDSMMSDSLMKTLHTGTWWFHMALSFGFVAWAPYTKMLHVLTSPLNIFTANLDGYGASLKPLDFEKAERLGVNALTDFTWKDLLDLDACTECGRCTAVCPANTVGKTLSPRDIILDLRELMHNNAPALLTTLGANGAGTKGADSSAPAGAIDAAATLPPVIREGTPLDPEALFSCTTCAACMEACPVHIEQLPKIIDARRYLVMEEAEFPEGMMNAITSLESRQHPFPGTQFNRTDWAEGLGLDVLGDMEDPTEAEVVFWVGCGGALVERNRSTVRATAKLLKRAGVKFAILGREESCTGDPARRIGNEFLYEMLAKGNVETLNKYGTKQIVTSCPHCFNSFKNEYPQFGGDYQVHHHSQYLQELVEDGRLLNGKDDVEKKLDRKVVYHDPCYLGRHNGEYKAPRALLDGALNTKREEVARSGRDSFCCGGGGGMMYIDEKPDQRVNQERASQLLESGADTVAVGCPFCATMLEDGVNARKGDREVSVMDIAELLLEAAGDDEASAPVAE